MFISTLFSLILAFSPIIGEAYYTPEPPTVETIAGTGSHGAQDGMPAQFNLPATIFGADDCYVFVTDTFNNLIRVIDGERYVNRIAGSVLSPDDFGFPRGAYRDGEALYSRFNRPKGGVIDYRGWIFIADSLNHVIRVIVDENVFTFAGSIEYGHADGSLEEARFNFPTAIAIGPCGGLFITDTLNHVIRRIDRDGYVTTIAGTSGEYGHYDGASDEAVFNSPMGIIIAEDGTIFVADTGNHMLRVIEDGHVRTLAGMLIFPDEDEDFDDEPLGGFADGYNAMFSLPMGLALWNDILIVADSVNHRIRAVLPCGHTITLAGSGNPSHADGPLLYAALHFPRGVLVRGNTLYIADTGNNSIRLLPLEIGLFEAEMIEGEEEND